MLHIILALNCLPQLVEDFFLILCKIFLLVKLYLQNNLHFNILVSSIIDHVYNVHVCVLETCISKDSRSFYLSRSPIPFLSADLFIVSTNKLDCQYRAINHTQIKFPSFDPSPWFLLLTFVFLCCFYTHLRLMKSTQGRPLLHSSTQSITHVSAHIKTHLSLN